MRVKGELRVKAKIGATGFTEEIKEEREIVTKIARVRLKPREDT
jgi:hypothetical protein